MQLRLVGFLGHQESRTAPGANRAHGENRRQTPSIGDTAGGSHRDRMNRVDNLGQEGQCGDAPGMSPGFGALRDDEVDAVLSHLVCGSNVPDQRDHFGVVGVQLVDPRSGAS